MKSIRTSEFVAAFPARKQMLAQVVARTLDVEGTGQLSPQNLARGLDGASSPDTFLHKALSALVGAEVVQGGKPSDIAQQVKLEAAVKGLTEASLLEKLRPLTKDPVLSIRDACTPALYRKSAEHVAKELARYGVRPFGDVRGAERSFLQSFWWEPRYGDRAPVQSWNVVGMVPGKAPPPGQQREVVVVMAHLDNLSSRQRADITRRTGQQFPTYEGASDNAGSVASLIEIARALQKVGPVGRDIVFFIPSGEEDGLKGSEAFMDAVKRGQVPGVTVENVRAALNLEILGSNPTEQLLVAGGSTPREYNQNGLRNRMLNLARKHGISVNPDGFRDGVARLFPYSDHYHFYREGIDTVMLHGGLYPEYHTKDDTLERCNMEKIKVGARLALRTLVDLANDPNPAERNRGARPHLRPFSPNKVWPQEQRPQVKPPRHVQDEVRTIKVLDFV